MREESNKPTNEANTNDKYCDETHVFVSYILYIINESEAMNHKKISGKVLA